MNSLLNKYKWGSKESLSENYLINIKKSLSEPTPAIRMQRNLFIFVNIRKTN